MTPLRALSLGVAVVLFFAGLAWGVYTAATGRFQPDWVASLWTLAAMAYSYAYFAKWHERWLKEKSS
ncbi:hypothetical protein [Pyrobaculum ferrireducens]|uniref:Uncharacterized protein n=1 Tax=Pyrobaculum ferrireducens TaxID=1104324 RepID=G7VAH5_9CREN|nr:hypothetical protein [Pyrobaculum ferrireducens]AET32214.1 hypothetical protein P186_0768 [Pyrobaculum ferrireducens]